MKRKPEASRARSASPKTSAGRKGSAIALRGLDFSGGLLKGVLGKFGANDTWRVNRMYLLVPAIAFLAASAGLSLNSTVQGVIAFVVAALILGTFTVTWSSDMV